MYKLKYKQTDELAKNERYIAEQVRNNECQKIILQNNYDEYKNAVKENLNELLKDTKSSMTFYEKELFDHGKYAECYKDIAILLTNFCMHYKYCKLTGLKSLTIEMAELNFEECIKEINDEQYETMELESRLHKKHAQFDYCTKNMRGYKDNTKN
ncbi:hypothetical protein BDAP_000179 [Binucleata daphniae]